MFGISNARCPLGDEDRSWVDDRLYFLATQFGTDVLWKTPVIEPTAAFFPGKFEPTEDYARGLMQRIAGFMGLAQHRLTLEVYDEHRHRPVAPTVILQSQKDATSAAGLYWQGDGVIGIEATTLRDPMVLVAVLAHELAHERLLGEGRINRGEMDHEPTTDLATVFFGLGIFGANCSVHFSQHANAGSSGWKSGRMGYLSEEVWAYALALWATTRRDYKPAWRKHLRLNLRTFMKSSMAWLKQHEDDGNITCLLRP